MKIIIKDVPVMHVEFENGYIYPLNDLNSILNQFMSTDECYESIIINNEELKNLLLKNNVIKENSRGSYYRGDKFEDFVNKVNHLIFTQEIIYE